MRRDSTVTRPSRADAEQTAKSAVTWFEVELGDGDVMLIEYPDGLFKLEIGGGETLLNADQMKDVTAGFATLKKAKGWRR